MTITLYGIRQCDTMKRARAWLDSRDIPYAFHDYKLDGIDDARLARWCREVGWERLINRAGTTFRKLDEAQRTDLDETRARVLMQAQPSMIHRPVLDTGHGLLVGFDAEAWQVALRTRPAT